MKRTVTTVLLAAMMAAPLSIGPAGADTDWSKHTDYNGHIIPTTYQGQPDLGLTLALVTAGGGPGHFSSGSLIKVLTGPLFDAEVKQLTDRFGQREVDGFLHTFTFAVDDAVAYAGSHDIAFPAKPSVDPSDGKALATALYAAGTLPSGQFDPGFMLEHLLSHPLHLRVMHDIDANAALGPDTDRDFHIVLTQAMSDLKSAYKF